MDDIAGAFSEAGLSPPIPIGTCVPTGTGGYWRAGHSR